jgi:hypothetical protein
MGGHTPAEHFDLWSVLNHRRDAHRLRALHAILSSHDKLATAISNLAISFFVSSLISPCWLSLSHSLSLSLCTPTTPPPRALVNRGALSTLLVSLHRALPRRPLQGCAHLRPQPSACFQHLRAFRLTRTALFCRLSPRYVAVTVHSRRHVSGGACVCEWLKRLGF